MSFHMNSDKGNFRENNEDSFISDKTDNYILLILADGMGGHENGELASKNAVSIVRNFISLNLHVVLKKRYAVISGEMTFDVDVFQGKNEGLVIAEFEGSPKAVAQMSRPWFASEEVTQDKRYANDRLAMRPFSEW